MAPEASWIKWRLSMSFCCFATMPQGENVFPPSVERVTVSFRVFPPGKAVYAARIEPSWRIVSRGYVPPDGLSFISFVST